LARSFKEVALAAVNGDDHHFFRHDKSPTEEPECCYLWIDNGQQYCPVALLMHTRIASVRTWPDCWCLQLSPVVTHLEIQLEDNLQRSIVCIAQVVTAWLRYCSCTILQQMAV
jgi:hypothetical protein